MFKIMHFFVTIIHTFKCFRLVRFVVDPEPILSRNTPWTGQYSQKTHRLRKTNSSLSSGLNQFGAGRWEHNFTISKQ